MKGWIEYDTVQNEGSTVTIPLGELKGVATREDKCYLSVVGVSLPLEVKQSYSQMKERIKQASE